MTLPNYITLFRILITPFFFTSLLYYQSGNEQYRITAIILLAIGIFSDALDGFLARITHNQSALGKFLDPLADKLLLLSGFLGFLFVDALPYKPPIWVTVTIVFRDMVIIIGLILIYLLSGNIRVKTNILGKFSTGTQMLTLILVLLKWPAAIPVCYMTAVITIVSCIVYMARDFKRLNLGNLG